MTESANSILRCWQCGKEISVLRTQAGANVECPHCKATVPVLAQLFGVPPQARTIGTAPASAAGKSPIVAGILNFFLWGAGYIYAGKSWVLVILVPLVAVDIILCFTIFGLFLSLAISIALGWHAYDMVKKINSASK
jgi:DNA-directed RNA polymerase subunit RPC12/RpoP